MFDEVEEQVSSAERASRRWVLIVVALNVAIVGLVLLLWNLRPRGPAWVVYDLASSRAATLHDYFCAPEIELPVRRRCWMAKRAFVTRFCRHSTRYPNAGEWVHHRRR